MEVSVSNIFNGVDKGLLAKFKKHLQINPGIYNEFKDMAYVMKNSGRNRYSAWAIINVIRWHRDLEHTDSNFKVSNDFIALYARQLISEHPDDFKDFFRLKKMKPYNRRYRTKEPSLRLV